MHELYYWSYRPIIFPLLSLFIIKDANKYHMTLTGCKNELLTSTYKMAASLDNF